MSARVFKPVVMELSRAMRGAGGPGDASLLGAAAAAAGAAAGATAGPDELALARVRRQLFGPVDHEETRRFVERELEAQSARDREYYEFDFLREEPQPRLGRPRRFSWERVRPGGVPESYALRRLSFLGAAPAAASDPAGPAPAAEAEPAPASEPHQAAAAAAAAVAAAAAAAAPLQSQPPCTPASADKARQAGIKEFLRACKRPGSSTADDGPAPGKRAKPADGAGAAAVAAAAAAATTAPAKSRS